jgi:hypothetical protein
MQFIYGIELPNDNDNDLIEPFLPIISTYVESVSTLFMFKSYDDICFLTEQLKEYHVNYSVHQLILIKDSITSSVISDYGYLSTSNNMYILKEMIAVFTITYGTETDIKMALLQFDEHLIAQLNQFYFIDLHQDLLIEKIAKAYNIKVSFLNLDKMFEND